MERLTEKPFRIDSEYCYEKALDESDCKFYRFVSEVEDLLEELGFESLEELKKCFDIWNSEDDEAFLKDNDNMKLRVYRFAKNELKFYIQLTQTLSNRWQKLKEHIEQLESETEVISEDLYFIKNKIQELEKDGENEKEN